MMLLLLRWWDKASRTSPITSLYSPTHIAQEYYQYDTELRVSCSERNSGGHLSKGGRGAEEIIYWQEIYSTSVPEPC